LKDGRAPRGSYNVQSQLDAPFFDTLERADVPAQPGICFGPRLNASSCGDAARIGVASPCVKLEILFMAHTSWIIRGTGFGAPLETKLSRIINMS
jgi:hypothetical protein